jgi:hypothetical protein
LCLEECGAQIGRSRQAVGHRATTLGIGPERRAQSREARQPKYATVEARNAAIGQATKERIARDGHPRGALGLQHTPEHLARMADGARRWNKEASPIAKENVRERIEATLLKRHGTLSPGFKAQSAAYSRTNHGRRQDLDNQFFRSMWEANYARYLNFLQAQGLILKWEYEPDTFWFEAIRRGTRSYLPDFKVTDPDGSVHYDEVKGWMDPKSKTKIARMAKYHPDVDLRVIDAKAYREIARKLGGAIAGWETDKRGRL